MAFSASQLTGGHIANMDVEVHHITWTSTTATGELTTYLSEIYGWCVGQMFGADTGHTDDDIGLLELDETVTSGVITPASNAVTINRIATNAAGTLAGQKDVIFLYGKS